jgi:hypothetical protein
VILKEHRKAVDAQAEISVDRLIRIAIESFTKSRVTDTSGCQEQVSDPYIIFVGSHPGTSA